MSHSSTSIRMIRIYYRGDMLELLDSDDRTPLYHVKVSSRAPQFRLVPLQSAADRESHMESQSSFCTASFKKLSFDVLLNLHGNLITMRRAHYFSRAYEFDSPAWGVRLAWEADGAITGDFRLVDASSPARTVLARFRNRLLSNSEVGSFEVIGDLEEDKQNELVITGLAELVMMQSLNLAGMVLFG